MPLNQVSLDDKQDKPKLDSIDIGIKAEPLEKPKVNPLADNNIKGPFTTPMTSGIVERKKAGQFGSHCGKNVKPLIPLTDDEKIIAKRLLTEMAEDNMLTLKDLRSGSPGSTDKLRDWNVRNGGKEAQYVEYRRRDKYNNPDNYLPSIESRRKP